MAALATLGTLNLGETPDLRLIEQLPFLYNVPTISQKKSPKLNLYRE